MKMTNNKEFPIPEYEVELRNVEHVIKECEEFVEVEDEAWVIRKI